ncbi:MAG: hypothetical protein GKS07_07275 [Nitrosopumilus sp.]|nr:MAG: hypothetical protein GKS07_07275 [Nitrosopumilus sp.]
MKITKVILYHEPTVPEIQLADIQKFVTDRFPVEIELRENFFASLNGKIFEKIATTRIFDLKKQFKKHIPSTEDIRIEKENKDSSEEETMMLYDGFELQKIITEYIPTDEKTDNILHVIFTNKTTCTFDDNNGFRYHARALIGSNPAIISTTGMIEAPAKPKQYYLDLMTCFSEDEIKENKEKYKGEFLEFHDSRLHKIAEGYLLQGIMYYETGEAFCDDKECRLFNAHWQKDLFYSQIENRKFCKRHSEIMDELKNSV